MCGKFTQMMGWGELVALADLIGTQGGPSETVTPMRFANIIHLDDDGQRRTSRMRWGLVPPWEKDPMRGSKFIHARAETLDEKRTFRDAFAKRRGILVVSTFNEGKEITPKKTEQYTIVPRGGEPLSIAVIWEQWMERAAGKLLTFAMVTVPANKLISSITDRMPAVVQPEDWLKWLGEVPAHAEELKAMLVPFDGEWDMGPEKPKTKKDASQPGLF